MTGWIVAGAMALIAAAAVAMLWRYHHRQLRRLRSRHQQAAQHRDDEHRRQLDRIRREHDRQLESAHHPLAEDLFPVLDSLDEARALMDDGEVSDDDVEEGLQLARTALYDALNRHGISAIAPEPGDPFDPEVHEAIARTPDSEKQPGTVRHRFRRGYRSSEQVLRPAVVEVNVADKSTESASTPPRAEQDEPVEGHEPDTEQSASPPDIESSNDG